MTAETEDEVYENIILGNTILEEASIQAQEISSDGNTKTLITQTRLSIRKKAALSIICKQLFYKLEDFSFIKDGLPPEIKAQVEALSIEQLEDLSIAVLDFNSLDDLSAYLQSQGD
ncbi:MAG: DUF4351 domain-containing protein [Cyanobacteria bacterium J06592_8]